MPQEQITRLVAPFIEHFDRFLAWNGMMKMPFGSLDDVYKRQSLKMDARDLARQSGRLLAEALAKNHAVECEDVFKLVFYIAEGGGPDNAYAIWPELRARLKRLVAEAVTTKSRRSAKRGRPTQYDAEREQRLIDEQRTSGLNLPEFAKAKGADRAELEAM